MRALYWLLPGFLAGIGVLFWAERVTVGLGFLFFFLRFALFVAAFYVFLGQVSKHSAAKTGKRRCSFAETTRLVIRLCTLFFLLSFVSLCVVMVDSAKREDLQSVACVVVAGAGLNGTEPTLILRQRLDKALAVLAENPEAIAVLTGGQGAGEEITEAEAMARYLTNRGIAENRLYLEEASRDTAENFANAAKILQAEGFKPSKTAIVTSDFHMFRSLRLATQNDLHPVAAPASTNSGQWHYYLREYFSILIYFIEQTGIELDTSALGL